MDKAATIKFVTLGRLTPSELLARLSAPGPESAILGEIICAMYWGGRAEFDLQRMELLSAKNWTLAVEIMGHRRSELWSEPQFSRHCAVVPRSLFANPMERRRIGPLDWPPSSRSLGARGRPRPGWRTIEARD